MTRVPKNNSGFTLIEMLVVIIILGLLAAFFGQRMFGKQDDTNVQVVRTIMLHSFPVAISGFYSTHQPKTTGGNLDITQELIDRGVKTETPWVEEWSAVEVRSGANAGQVLIEYPIGGDKSVEVAKIIQKELDAQGDFDHVIGAQIKSTSTIEVRFRIQRTY